MTALADSGFIVALENSRDRYHTICMNLLRREQVIFLPQSVLNEVCYFLTKIEGNLAAARFLNRVQTSKFLLISLAPYDLNRTAEPLVKYADTRVDFVDASVCAVAERLNVTRILTLDRRDFDILRPAHVDHFEILP